jgi:hypothetical protein
MTKAKTDDALAVSTVLNDLLDKPDTLIMLTKTPEGAFLVRVMWKEEAVGESVGGSDSLFTALNEAKINMEGKL